MNVCLKCGNFLWKRLIFCCSCRPQYSKKLAVVDNFKIEYFLDWSYETSQMVRSLKYGFFPKEYDYLPKSIVTTNTKIVVAPASQNKRYQHNHAWCLAKTIFSVEPIDTLIKMQEQKMLKKKNRKDLVVTNHLEEKYRSVIFVDDVVTTGTTVNACYKALKEPKDFKVVALAYVSDSSKL